MTIHLDEAWDVRGNQDVLADLLKKARVPPRLKPVILTQRISDLSPWGEAEYQRRKAIHALPGITPEQRQDAWDLDMPVTEAAALLTSGWPDEDSLAILRALRGLPPRQVETHNPFDLIAEHVHMTVQGQ